MALDWGLIQVIVPVAVIPLVLPGYWWRNLKTISRWVWLAVWREDDKCDYLEWKEIAQNPRAPVHTCDGRTDTDMFRYCRNHPQHQPGEMCWKAVLDRYFNTIKKRTKIKKPFNFPLRQPLLCVDMKIIKAFMLMSLHPEHHPYAEWIPSRAIPSDHFMLGNLEITAERHEDSGEVLVHIIPNYFFKNHLNLTPHEIDCLLRGYPPYYREYINCYNYRVPSPIQSDADIYRGGWVIGVGLGSSLPLPLYVDSSRIPHHFEPFRQRNMFWRSLTRVRDVVENNIKPLYLDEPGTAKNVQATLNVLTYLIREGTDSGSCRSLQNSDMINYTERLGELTQDQCINAMRIFNGNPNLDDEGLERMREELTPMLFEVLKAVVRGAVSCMGYIKYGDKELDSKVPGILRPAVRVFLKGCEESL